MFCSIGSHSWLELIVRSKVRSWKSEKSICNFHVSFSSKGHRCGKERKRGVVETATRTRIVDLEPLLPTVYAMM